MSNGVVFQGSIARVLPLASGFDWGQNVAATEFRGDTVLMGRASQ